MRLCLASHFTKNSESRVRECITQRRLDKFLDGRLRKFGAGARDRCAAVRMSMNGPILSAACKQMNENDSRFISETPHSKWRGALVGNLRDDLTDGEQNSRHPFGGVERSI
jgi:hypothetical protein